MGGRTDIKKRLGISVFLAAMLCGIASEGTIYSAAADPPTHATNPDPPDGAEDVSIETNLTWTRGDGARWDKVYFGTDPCDMYLPLVDIIEAGLPAEHDPGDPNLLPSTTYYWYITEVNGTDEYKGPLWSFTIVRREARCKYPENGAVIDGDVYLENLYTELIFIPGPTAVKHTGYFSKVRDEVANRVEDANLGPPPYGDPCSAFYDEETYYAGIPLDYWEWVRDDYDPYVFIPTTGLESLERGQVYYWTVDEKDGLGNTFPGDVWEFTIQGYKAFGPSPPNEAVDVDTTVLLSWYPGVVDNGHAVYIGTSWDDVNNAIYHPTSPPPEFLGNVSEPNILVTGLEFNTKYYWRVDECAARCPPLYNCCFYYKGDVWCFTTVPHPHRIFVDIDAAGANDGTNWADAYNYLQDALADASSADEPVEIRIAEGIYTPDSNSAEPNGSGDRTTTFKLINGVTLKGGYAGFGEANPDARDLQLYETILSGDLAGNDVEVERPHYLHDHPSRVENSYHVVTGSGTDETAIIDGFSITGGKAEGSYPHYCGGGGMYSNSGNPTVTKCTFIRNSSFDFGGGMFNYNSSPTLANCLFNINDGGGMENDYSSPRLIQCVFNENSDNGMFNYQSDTTVTNCIFTGNTGVRHGGGILNDLSSATITNCTFSGNKAGSGGGLYNWHNSGSILTNCIFWDNTPDQINGDIPTVTYSNIQGGWAGLGNIDANPCFVLPGYWDVNGTPTDQRDDFWVNGDYHLLPFSPCIDVGDNSTPNLPATDLDGHPRIIDGDCDGTDVVDMGAYEFSLRYLGDFDNDCNVDFADFSIFGLAWMTKRGDAKWNQFCDISKPSDNYINLQDAVILCNNWLAEIP